MRRGNGKGGFLMPITGILVLLALLSGVMVANSLLAVSGKAVNISVRLMEAKPTAESMQSSSINSGAAKSDSERKEAAAAQSGVGSGGSGAHDADTEWSEETTIHIFDGSYENSQQQLTVNSERGDRVIAPGTDGTYQFYVENAETFALDYRVEAEARAYLRSTNEKLELPVEVRFSDHAGTWLAGTREAWAAFEALNGVTDQKVLSAKSYASYTLEWRWPFEQENVEPGDVRDTAFGNLAAAGEDLVVEVVLRVSAEADENRDASGSGIAGSSGVSGGSGSGTPKTGDETHAELWLMLFCGAAAVLLMLFLWGRKERNENRSR